MHYHSKRLYIDLQSGCSFALANIALHPNVHHVIVRKSPSLSDITNDENYNDAISLNDELRIFESIASLPYLTRLDVSELDYSVSLPADGLTTVLNKAQTLTTLRLESVHVAGRVEDFCRLVQALKNHASLEEIYLRECLPVEETEITQALADALIHLPTLRLVEIVETKLSPPGFWQGKALATLCQSQTLQVLRIQGMRFLRDTHIKIIAEELEKNTATTSLRELNLQCDIGKEALSAICNLLRVNSTIEILNLNRIVFGEQAPEIADALVNNATLRSLHLYFHYGSVRNVRSSFQALMERNYTLENMTGGWACSNIDFYLRLNQAGRAILLKESGNATPKEWVDVMAERQDCVSSLFYLLSQNPSLCKVAS